MRLLICLLIALLAGCDIEELDKENTIRDGKVFWYGPDMAKLTTALTTCKTVSPKLADLCADRQSEAEDLLIGLKSCDHIPLPSCQVIIAWADAQDWKTMANAAGIGPKAYGQLPAEDLYELLPHNPFVRALWGWDDVRAVILASINRHILAIIGTAATAILSTLLVLWWRWWGRDAFQERRANARLAAASQTVATQVEQEKRQRDEAERQRKEEAQRAQLRQQEEEGRLQELARQKAAAAEAAKQQRIREENERKAAAAEAEKAQAILQEAFSTDSMTPRKPSKWVSSKPDK